MTDAELIRDIDRELDRHEGPFWLAIYGVGIVNVVLLAVRFI
jgi:hypothetical protein